MILSILQTPGGEAAKQTAQPVAPSTQPSVRNTEPAVAPARAPIAASKAPTAPVPGELGSFAGARRPFKWLQFGRAKKRLQMLETVSLGEKRFVALVQVDGRQFLIGGAPSNVGMLAELAPEESFHQVLREATQGLATAAAAPSSVAAQDPQPSVTQPQAPVDAAVAPAIKAVGLQEKAGVTAASAVDPLNSVDDIDESPFSLSPTVLARMETKPAPTAPPEHVELQPVFDADVAAPPAGTAADENGSAFGSLPAFTFQISPALPSIIGAFPEQTHYKFGIGAARRMASAWKLKEATS